MKRRTFCGSLLASAATASWPAHRLFAAAPVPGDLPARRLDGAETVLAKADVRDLAGSLRGALLLPGNDAYERARRVWNGMIDRRPALIVEAAGASDVIQAVNFAREHALLTAVRGGGHSTSGQSVCDGGIMLSLANMRGVRVDPRQRRARVEAGALLGDLDREAQFFGLVTTAGTVSHTGAAGLTLGGGFGRLGRRFGLTCDNVESMDIVTADGQYRIASSREHKDLYWALRGGGGNFGVVTSFEYRLHEFDPVIYGGSIVWPFEQAREVLRFFTEFAPEAPRALNTDLALVAPPGRPPLVSVEVCYSGRPGDAERAIAPLRAVGKPVLDQVRPMPYLKLQTGGDAGTAWGQLYYLKSGFVQRFDSDLIEAFVEGFRGDAQRTTIALMQQLGGAIAEVGTEATAFPHRQAVFDLLVLGAWTDAAESDRHIAELRATWRGLAPFTRGYYFNTQIGDSQDEVRANYGPNYDRLVAIKTKYDPGNLFRLNANIRPRA